MRLVSLRHLATGRGVVLTFVVGEGHLPTQRRHSRASPSARSQRPISRGGSPASFAQARLLYDRSCINFEAKIRHARNVLRGQSKGEGSGGIGGSVGDGVFVWDEATAGADGEDIEAKACVRGAVSGTSSESSMRTVGTESS